MNEEQEFYTAITQFNQQHYTEAVRLTSDIIKARNLANDLLADTYYLQARAFAALERSSSAKSALIESLSLGFYAVQHMKSDTSLAKVFLPEQWQDLIQAARNNLIKKIKQQKVSLTALNHTASIAQSQCIEWDWLSLTDDYYRTLLRSSGLSIQPSDCFSAIYAVGKYVKSLWSHSPNQVAEVGTSQSILNEAIAGASFRCLEYALLFCDLIAAVGHRARLVYLFTKTVAKPKLGQSHVVAEVFCVKTRQWIAVDVQWGVIPKRNEQMLSALQLQASLYRQAPVQWLSIDQESDRDTQLFYEYWLLPYLHFIGVLIDQNPKTPVEAKKAMAILVPDGELPPTYFQGNPLPWQFLQVAPECFISPPSI